MNVEISVRERYSKAAQNPEPALCCPVGYDPDLLRLIPEEILERDYGCGDPTGYVRSGEGVPGLWACGDLPRAVCRGAGRGGA